MVGISLKYSGVNLHGGTGKSVANSVGGSLHGDGLLQTQGETPEQIAMHPHPFYTPITTLYAHCYVWLGLCAGSQSRMGSSGGILLTTDF